MSFLLDGTTVFRLGAQRWLLAEPGAPAHILGSQGWLITVAGVDWTDRIQVLSISDRLRSNSTLKLTSVPFPVASGIAVEWGDEVVVTDIASGDVVAGGYVDVPDIQFHRGGAWVRWDVSVLGYDVLLQTVRLDQAEGVAVAQAATPRDQLLELVTALGPGGRPGRRYRHHRRAGRR